MADIIRQGIVLLALAAVCASIAAVAHPGDQTGLLALGMGLLLASVAARWRLLLAALVVTPFALVNIAWSAGILATNYLFGAYVLAAALGIGATTIAARHALVGAHPVTPVALLAIIGVLLLAISVPHDPFGAFFSWFVSWWMPAAILGMVGIVRVALGMIARPAASQRSPHAIRRELS
jgi:hypothetical protein